MDIANIDSADQASAAGVINSFLKQTNPDLDVSPGTAISELVVMPASAVYAAVSADIDAAIANLSITEGTDDEIALQLMANIGIEPRAGTEASGVIAIYLTSNEQTIIPSATVFTAGSQTLKITTTYIGLADLENIGLEGDTSAYRAILPLTDTSWYMTVPAVTSSAMTTEIPTGTTVTADIAPGNVSRMEVASTFAGGSAAETTADAKARSIDGVTAKVLSGRTHIESFMRDLTPPSLDVSVIGMGDAEMLRWYNSYGSNPGGRVDIISRTASYPAETQFSTMVENVDPVNNKWRCVIPKTAAPGFYGISRITHSTGYRDYTNDIVMEFSTDVSGEDYIPDYTSSWQTRFSKFQTVGIEFEFVLPESPTLGQTETMIFSLIGMPGIEAQQDAVSALDVRDLTGDFLVKAPSPVFVSVEMRVLYYDAADVPDTSAIADAVAKAINDTPMRRGYLTTADLVAAAYSVNTNMTILMPIVLTSVTIPPSGDTIYRRSVDTLYIPENATIGLTKNTAAFISSASMVSVTATRANQFLG